MSSFAQVREKVLHLYQRLEFKEQNGVLEADGTRMLMLSARGFGRMRQELINTIGEDLARGLLKRYGYQAGFDDAHCLCTKFPGLSLEEQMHLGTLVHQREGAAMIETVPDETEVDLENDVLHITSRWINSAEADQHVQQVGPSTSPVCWSLAGYASGHLSFLLQRDVIVLELTCVAQGHSHCTFRVGFCDEMEQEFPGCREDFRSIDLMELFGELEHRMEEQRRHIAILEAQARETEEREGTPFERIIGESPAMEKVLRTAAAVSRVDSTILITGESGTGKELVARAIHESSLRTEKPYITVNCATLTESLQNSELFGYARGAFTGANRDHPGLFEDADGGTLFLDEVGELSASAQAALLRVLQDGTISRVGETRERQVNVRLLAATHRDLEDMVEEGRFRQDLFFRLNVVQVRLPPLRKRSNDVLLLANHFIQYYAKKFSKRMDGLSPEVILIFLDYPWPGNVRELQNAIERSVLLSTTHLVEATDLPECFFDRRLKLAEEAGRLAPANAPTFTGGGEYDERATIEEALRQAQGAKGAAAEILGISRSTLWRKIKEYDLRTDKGYWKNQG